MVGKCHINTSYLKPIFNFSKLKFFEVSILKICFANYNSVYNVIGILLQKTSSALFINQQDLSPNITRTNLFPF